MAVRARFTQERVKVTAAAADRTLGGVHPPPDVRRRHMTLRPESTVHSRLPRPLATRPFALAALAVLTLALFAGGAIAGSSDYPSPLYLSGAASSQVTGSFTLVSGAGPGQPGSAPTAVAGAADALTNTYQYAYTVADPVGGQTAPSPLSLAVSVTNQSVTVGNLPTGVTVDLYRQ